MDHMMNYAGPDNPPHARRHDERHQTGEGEAHPCSAMSCM